MNLIFLHGLGQTSSSWNKTVASLPPNIGTHCPDLFHLGELCKQGKRTYEELYLAFETYADGFSMPLHLCGISLGAILALHYTLNHPDNVSSLVLIAPQYKMPKFLLSIQSMVFHRMPERSFSKVGITKQDFISLTNSMRNLDFTWNLKTILCPTLIICGQTDTANIRAAKKTAARISNATLHIIEKAGHEVNIEAPQKLANLLNLFYGATIF